MGLQDLYGNDQTNYNEPTGSSGMGGSSNFGNDRNGPQYGPQTQSQAYNTQPIGPLTQTPAQVSQDYYYGQMAQNAPGVGELLGAGAGALAGDPMGLIGLVKNYIGASNQSTQETIQNFINSGMSQQEATDLVNYASSQGGGPPNTGGPNGDRDPQTGSFLSPQNVAGGGGGGGYGSMEEYIRSITPEAMGTLTAGTESALTREQQALQESLGLLSPYSGDAAYQETAALTGAMGEDAQRAAITGIPLSEAQRAMQEREQRQQMRLANTAGRSGGGATIQEMINLGGRQQAETVSNRLNQLSPIADINRNTASTMSGLEEGSLTRQAQLEQQLGPQLAAILMGEVGPITETRSSAAELSGLQNVNEASQNAELMSQIANMIGSWSGENS